MLEMKKNLAIQFGNEAFHWSEYKDSEPWTSGPKPDALPGCATLEYSEEFAHTCG